jgi:hypothetical protein
LLPIGAVADDEEGVGAEGGRKARTAPAVAAPAPPVVAAAAAAAAVPLPREGQSGAGLVLTCRGGGGGGGGCTGGAEPGRAEETGDESDAPTPVPLPALLSIDDSSRA